MKIPKAKQLPSGAWHCRVMVDGRDISITRDTEKEAVAEAMAIKARLKNEKSRPQSITLRTAYERYIEMKDGILSPSTITGYRRLARNTMQGIMDLSLFSLTTEKIQREVNKMAKDGKSQKYIANASGLLSSVLSAFYADFQYHVTLPPKRKQTQRALSVGEIERIFNACKGTSVELPVLMALWMGMRLSEIRGARYEDISGNKLHICRAIVETDTNPTEKPPKTFDGDRWVNIPPYIKTLIGAGNGYIVPLSGAQIYKRFQTILKHNNIAPCRFHDLRHANAAVMIRLGIDSKYAQERNGWKSDYMYKQIYGYVMDDKLDENDNAINSFFDSIRGGE